MTTISSGSVMIIILCLVPESDEGDDETDSGHPQAHIEDHICVSTRLCTKLLSCFFLYKENYTMSHVTLLVHTRGLNVLA
jgi:hypothetical protein